VLAPIAVARPTSDLQCHGPRGCKTKKSDMRPEAISGFGGKRKQECSRVLTEDRQEISSNGVGLAEVNQEFADWLVRVGLSLRSRRRSGPRSVPAAARQDAEDERACLPPTPGSTDTKIGVERQPSSRTSTRSAAWRALSAPFPTTQGRVRCRGQRAARREEALAAQLLHPLPTGDAG
jgi:hypothetical protein